MYSFRVSFQPGQFNISCQKVGNSPYFVLRPSNLLSGLLYHCRILTWSALMVATNSDASSVFWLMTELECGLLEEDERRYSHAESRGTAPVSVVSSVIEARLHWVATPRTSGSSARRTGADGGCFGTLVRIGCLLPSGDLNLIK